MGRGSSGVPVRAGARRNHQEHATAVPGHRLGRDAGTGSGAGKAAVALMPIVTVDTVDTVDAVGRITLASAAFPRTRRKGDASSAARHVAQGPVRATARLRRRLSAPSRDGTG
jgi:hypothetical protein